MFDMIADPNYTPKGQFSVKVMVGYGRLRSSCRGFILDPTAEVLAVRLVRDRIILLPELPSYACDVRRGQAS